MDRHQKELLINCVRDVKAIWDKGHPHHHNVNILAKHWKMVASKVGKSDKEVKTTWKNLRQEFGKQWRKCSRSGEAAPDEIDCGWPFYAAMTFLTDQFKPREMIGNIKGNQNSGNSISEEGDDEMSLPPPQSPALSLPMSASVPSSMPPSQSSLSHSSASASGFRQRKPQQSVIGEALISIEKEKLDLRRSKVQEPEDDNLMFLKSLAPQMRKLDPQRNILFRTEMQGRLYELLYPQCQQVPLPSAQRSAPTKDTYSRFAVPLNPQFHDSLNPANDSFSLTEASNLTKLK